MKYFLKNIIIKICILVLCLINCLILNNLYAQSNENNLQHELNFKLDTIPTRIVSTSPAITEILHYVGVLDKVVGVTKFCDYPAEVSKIEKIGDLNLNYEKIVMLKPDVVFIMKGLRAREAEILNSFGLKTIELNLNSIENIFNSIDYVAKIFNVQNDSKVLRKKLNNLKNLINKKQGKIVKTVYFEIWGDPPMTIGKPSFINEIIENAHGINIFNESNLESLNANLEKVVENNPQFIILAYDANTTEITLRTGFDKLIAVKDGNILKVDYNIYVRPSHRILDAILDLYNKLFPKEPISYDEIN